MRCIEILSLHKRFGDIVALAGLDLKVEAGESIVILGPSGSGKSTLLRVIAGIEDPDDGDVLFDGESQLQVAPHRRGVAMVFQNFALYPHLSARQNMLLGLRHGLKLGKEESEERVLEVANTLEITDLLDRRPGKMSGGQRQRVALGRALARRAEIILLDEPLSGLDAQLKQELRLEIRTLLQSLGTTAIFVTHDQLDAMAIGDRIAVMNEGEIVQIGTPEQIYEHPASTFVARFVGSPPMNLLPGRIENGLLISPGESLLELENVPDGDVWIGVRPERLHPEGKGEYSLSGEVIAEELSAGEWIVHLKIGEHVVAIRAEFEERPQTGKPMNIAAARRDIRLFDRKSGEEVSAWRGLNSDDNERGLDWGHYVSRASIELSKDLRSQAHETLKRIQYQRSRIEFTDSKTRVMSTVEGKLLDRVPIDLWASKEVKQDLENLFDCSYAVLLDALGVDFRVVHGPSYIGLEMVRYPDGSFQDLWGVRRIRIPYGEGDRRGTYKEVVESPLAEARSIKDIEGYSGWPSPDWWDYSEIAEQCQQYTGHCVVYAGDRLDRTAQLKTAMYLRGMERIFLDLVEKPAFVECILEHVTHYYKAYNRRVFEAAAEHIDIFMMGDDFGMQTGPLMKMEIWERFFEGGFREYIDLAHEYNLKIMHHTCGGVRPLIPKFIDAGLDILQSLQPRAEGMDLAGLKRDFGDKLAFHGSVDIQKTLPFGAPEDVRYEVQTRMRAGKPGGRFIICTAHNIQRDTPLINVLALLEAYYKFGANEKDRT